MILTQLTLSGYRFCMGSRLGVPSLSTSQVEIRPRCVFDCLATLWIHRLTLHEIHALILENTFTSLPKLVPHALPLLGPLSFLCHQKWDSASKFPLIPRSTPILMLSGVKDEVVPREHMKELWEIATKRQGTKVNSLDGDGDARDGGKREGNPEVGSGKSRFVEFAQGYHSTSLSSSSTTIVIDLPCLVR